jgi:hypothetical protein
MSDQYRQHIDSREHDLAAAEHYADMQDMLRRDVDAEPTEDDLARAEEECPTDADYEEMADYFDAVDDGQPSEYDEWQDLYGGDDWDHGQYDEVY